MNRNNFTALCATFLMCAIMIVFYAGFAVNRNPLAIAYAQTISVANEDDTISNEKVIYLTFDDGPSDRVTPKILDVLKDEGVKATFFIIGKNAETRKYLIQREIEEGHSVAVHSYSHDYKEIYSCPEKLIKDIDKCNAVIKDITGKKSKIYRFPGGSFWLRDELIKAVTAHGMRYVDWNASTRDAELINPTPAELFKSAVNTPANRDLIVLLAHDSTTRTSTAQALRDIIKYYKNRGYLFATFK